MDQTINTAVKEPVKRSGSSRNNRKAKENKVVTNIDTTAARLNTHEEVCSWRYANIDAKMKTIEDRLDTLEVDVKDLKSSNAKGFNEIKEMLADARDEKFKTIITVAGTIVVALLGMMGYLLGHIK